jgi:hypothetical protein
VNDAIKAMTLGLILEKNFALLETHKNLPALAFVEAQEKLIQECLELGFTREQFFEQARVFARQKGFLR